MPGNRIQFESDVDDALTKKMSPAINNTGYTHIMACFCFKPLRLAMRRTDPYRLQIKPLFRLPNPAGRNYPGKSK